jgi:hypothetical protein
MKYATKANNKTAILAILAVFAMVAAGTAVVMASADVDADVAKSAKWSRGAQGTLDFAATGFVYETYKFTNADLGNDISVRYDDSNKTYYVTGTINKQSYASTMDKTATTSKAVVAIYGYEYLKEKGTNYALAFGFVSPAAGCQVKVGTDGAWSAEKAENAVEDCILVIKQAGKAPVTVKNGGIDTIYYIDTTGATFATSNSSKTGYTALYGANALADTATVAAGTDTKGGTWAYSGSTLTLNNYNGTETFNLDGMTKLILAGDNAITVKGGLTAVSSTALKISNDSGVATLSVNITTDADGAYGIHTTGALDISGVDVAITIAGKAVDAFGIRAGDFSVFNSTQVISVLPSAYNADETGAVGILAANTDIKSSDITVVAGYKGLVAGDLDVTASALDATASLYAIMAGEFNVAQTSSVEATALGLTTEFNQPYGIVAEKMINKSYSEIAASGILLTDGASENYATITNVGSMLIEDGATFTNKTDGEFYNTGIIGVVGGINVEAGTFDNDGAISTLKNITGAIAVLDLTAGTFTKQQNYPKTITNAGYELLADGTVSVAATVAFHGAEDWTSDAGRYIGIATIDETGKILTMNLTAASDNGEGKKYTSRIALTSSAVGEAGSVIYSIVSSGSYYKAGAENSTAGTVKTTSAEGQAKLAFATLDVPTAEFAVTGGDLLNDGAILIGSLADPTILNDGSITSTGSIISAVAIDMTKGTFTSTGTMALGGNFAINGGSFVGDLVVDEDVAVTVKGSIVADINYAGTFTPAATVANPNPTPIAFLNVVDVAGTGSGAGFVITASQPIATETGLFALTNLNNIATKGAAFIIEEGTATIATDGDVGLASAGTVTALAGTTLTNVAALKVSGVIAIQDGAVFNFFQEDVVETYTYGTLDYTISFANDGYTYYGNLAFALANAEEGMILYLAANETISKDTAVKDGIQLIFAENAALTVQGTADKPITLTMGNGANFILDDNASVKVRNAKVSGTIVYEDNGVILNGLAIGDIADVAISAVPEAGLVPAYIEFNAVAYSDGVIEMASGYFGGDITLAATMSGTKVKTAAELDIDEDAVSMVALAAGENAAKAKIVLDGTIAVDAGNINLFAPITGEGAIILAAGATATLVDEIAQSIIIGNDEDGFALDNVMSDAAGEDLLKFTSVAATATEPAYVKVSGTLTDGILTVIGDAATDKLDLEQNAAAETPTIGVLVIPDECSFTVIKDGVAVIVDVDGAIRVAGEFNYYTTETDKYGVVEFDITYEDAGYTVFAKLAGAAATAPAGTDFEITKEVEVDTLVLNKGQTLTISGTDGVLVVNNMVIIGKPATSIGATDAIVGKVHLEAGAFAIAYSGSDVSGAKFVYGGDDAKAKYSNYSIANTTYCDVYAAANVEFADVNAELGVPQIEGMKFQGWVTYVAGAEHIGESDVYGRTIAVQYKITLKSIEGAVYKVEGSSAVVLDSPFYVDAGTVVNAVAAAGYKGTTQTWIVDKDQVIVASGFSPVEPEPTPEPSAGGLSLTDILLVVLVVLIAIMVIIVLLKLNRS